MAITLLHHRQIDLFEKILSRRFAAAEILNYETIGLIDDKTGKPIVNAETGKQSSIEYSWTGSYAVEAFVNVLECFLLAEKIGAVCPIEDGAALIGAHWATVMKAGDAVLFADSQKKLDKGAIDLRFLEWLYGPGNDEDILMWARAYNGQFDDLGEPVSLRLATSDYARLRGEMNGFNEAVEREERIDETGVLGSPLIFRAYEALCKEYKVKMTELFGTLTRLVLPPLASAYLGRLPKGATAEQMLDILFTLREELAPVRAKFALLRASDHPDVSPAEAQKAIAAISADAKSFAKRWDSSVTDNAVIQFCLEHVSFVLKCLLKPDKVEAEEIAAKLAKIAPPLERYLRSSAPTELSTIALETRKIGQIKHLLDAKLGLRFAD